MNRDVDRSLEYVDFLLRDVIPAHFVDDGASWSPDSLAGTDIRPFARVHDWFYCSRAGCYGAEWMPSAAMKRAADTLLRQCIYRALPSGLRGWISWLYWRGVYHWGHTAYNSCWGGEARCRHNLPRPAWMDEDLEVFTP